MPHALRSGTAWDRHKGDYAYVRELDYTGWAWEFLRRHCMYQRDRRAHRHGHPVAISHVSGATLYRPWRRFLAAEAWGLELFADPEKTALQTDVFWLPELLTQAVTCQCHSVNDNGSTAICLSSFYGRRAVLAGLRDEHVTIAKDREAASLVIERGTFLLGKSVVTFMHEGLNSASDHFANMQILKHFTVEKPRSQRPLSYSESKYLDYLIALDGHLEGRNLREIAIVLHGPDAVRSSWVGDASWMKSNVRRAVANGKELMNGGYRKLL